MAGRYPTDEHTSEDPEDYMHRARKPTSTIVGATECACGAQKGKALWARVANGKPKGTKCSKSGNPSKWSLEVGYTNKSRVAIELEKRSFNKLKGMVKGLREAMRVGEQTTASFRTERLADIDAIVAEIDAVEKSTNRASSSSNRGAKAGALSSEGYEELGHQGCEA